MTKRQIEIPVHNNAAVTSRSLKNEHPNNANLYETSQEFQDLLKEVKIRFDTNPKFYQKEDYQKLIELIRKKSGQPEITVQVSGTGNIVTNVSYKDGILTIEKDSHTEEKIKECFPDYAFWQKNYVKKGGQCLWFFDKKITNDFPIGKKIGYIWLEIGRRINSTDFQISVEDLKKIQESEYNDIEFRIGVSDTHVEEQCLVQIHFGPNLENTIVKEVLDYGLMHLEQQEVSEILQSGGNTVIIETLQNDSLCKHESVIYIAFEDYFRGKFSDKLKAKLYVIQWKDQWTFTPLNQHEIKCKYHQLVVKLYNKDGEAHLSRNTWREYSEPEINIFTKRYYETVEYYDPELEEYIEEEQELGTLDQLEDLLIFGLKTKRNTKLKIKGSDDSEDNSANEDNQSLLGLGERYIFPDFTDEQNEPKLPVVYSTYQRHGHWNKVSIRNKRRTFEWTSYLHGPKESNRCPSILERIFYTAKRLGTIPQSNWFNRYIGSNSGHAIIYVRIPYDYVLKGQSSSWSNRSRIRRMRSKHKIFFRGKIACFRVVLSYGTKHKQVSISLDKTPFIMPKICY